MSTGLNDTTRFPAKDSLIRTHLQDYLDEQFALKASVAQDGWIAATLQNSWTNNATYDVASYMKDTLGYVHIKGSIANGTTTNGTIIFQLPVGYRPLKIRRYVVLGSSNAMSVIYVDTNGNVTIQLSNSVMWIEGIIFKAGE